MNLIYLEKTAGSIGKTIAKTIVKHPLGSAAAIGGTALVGGIVGTNLYRLYSITNELGKRKVMNYQTEILKNIAQNINKGNLPAPKQQIPIIPPLR